MVSGDLDQGYLLARLLTPQSYIDHLEIQSRTSVYSFLVAVTAILLFVLSVFNRSMKRTQQLSEAKAQSAAIVNGTQDAIIGITKEAVLTIWNRPAESLFNYNEEYAKDKTVSKLALFEDVADLHCESVIRDGHRFSQILSNLISNAIKFTENGYVKVLASSQFCDDGQLILHCSVSDSGVGISDNNKSKLFKAFAQKYTAVAAKYGGTDLGLAICRQLVGLLHGDIDFTSVKDEGSTFSFSITAPQFDCKQVFLEPSLKDKSCLILVPHVESYENIQRIFHSCAGEILEYKLYAEWLLNEIISILI